MFDDVTFNNRHGEPPLADEGAFLAAEQKIADLFRLADRHPADAEVDPLLRLIADDEET
jgi:hypothetical protein